MIYSIFRKLASISQKLAKNETNSDSFLYNNDVHSWWYYIFLSYFQLLVLSQSQKNSKEILLFSLRNKYERIFYSFIHYFWRGSLLQIRYFNDFINRGLFDIIRLYHKIFLNPKWYIIFLVYFKLSNDKSEPFKNEFSNDVCTIPPFISRRTQITKDIWNNTSFRKLI